LQTIFSPLTTALKLAGETVFSHMRAEPDLLEAGLEVISDVTIRFALDALQAGAHGFFLASQTAQRDLLSDAEFARFTKAFDLKVMSALREPSRYLITHVHGDDIRFTDFADYPSDMLSWHDRH